MNINLKNKKAIVCGASKGIGAATARELASLGAEVTVLARRKDVLETVKDSLSTMDGQKHHALEADFFDLPGLQNKISTHVQNAGPFHILINNSGGPPAGPAHTAKLEEFQKAFSQHLLGNHVMTQAVLEGMKAEKYGRIVNVISTSVKTPIKGLGVSNTVRGAVANWAKTLSFELAPFGITVNNILPGATDTDRLDEVFVARSKKLNLSKEDVIAEELSGIPAGRFASPEELAQAIAFLASPAAAYINGINLPVDGGRTGCL